ncbi:LuxR family transcriptional regulator [soil metagenome]
MSVPPTGTVTFLFTDIEGSTKLWETDSESMSEALVRHDELLRSAIEARDGYVFKTVGDAFCAAFPTALDALEASVEAQRWLLEEQWPETGRLKARMALHTGATEERDGDYFGPPVNRVARLLSAAHGGQVLLSLPTHEMVRDQLPAGTVLVDLGERRLKDLFRPERIFQLRAPALPSEFPPLRTLESRPNNLPLQPTPLVGREREVGEVADRVQSDGVRLLTLTGPGGTGKTRLALQAAADLLEEFEDGAFFVALATITDPELVPSTIAGPLGVKESAEQPLTEVLKGYLREKDLLLILDNFEQVLEGASVVGELVAACPKLKVLATSRIPLRLYGEQEYAVPPLALPDPRVLPPVEVLTQYEAVRLFVERARAVKAEFSVTNENAPAIAEICARLDGLPLAIELAGARVRILPPQKMLERLSNRLKLLKGGARDLPTRQQTLRGAIDWSHDLLEGDEKTLFGRLSVFSGGRTLEAIEEICDPEGDLDALEGVESLVEKSLLRQEEGPEEEPRFVMLETVHEYAREKLEESGEAEGIKCAHAEYFLALAEEAEPGLKGPDQLEWLERLEVEHDNMRAALSWALESEEEELALRLAGALWWFWFVRGHYGEGRRWLERALGGEGGAPVSVRAKALVGAGGLAAEQGEIEKATATLEEGVRLFRASEEAEGLVDALNSLCGAMIYGGKLDAAKALTEESLMLCRDCGSRWGVAEALNNVGLVSHLQDNDWDRTESLYKESLEVRRELHDKRGIMMSLNNLGIVARKKGDLHRAVAHLEEALSLGRNLADKSFIANTSVELGYVELGRGDWERAAVYLREGMSVWAELGDEFGTFEGLWGLAQVAEASEEVRRAGRLFGAADRLRETSEVHVMEIEHPEFGEHLEAARSRFEAAGWTQAYEEGRAMTTDEAVSYALKDDRD